MLNARSVDQNVIAIGVSTFYKKIYEKDVFKIVLLYLDLRHFNLSVHKRGYKSTKIVFL
jgi:hypothetical protein